MQEWWFLLQHYTSTKGGKNYKKKKNWELQKEEKVDAVGFSLLSPDELKPSMFS